MAKHRKPNHDAQGNNLAGQEVYYNASTGDKIVIGGFTHTVVDTWPNGVKVARGMDEETLTYRELKRRGAFFAQTEEV